MLTYISTILQGLLVFIALVAVVILRRTARGMPAPIKDEPQQKALARLWQAYRINVASTLVSPWFWGAAGLMTAALLYFNQPH